MSDAEHQKMLEGVSVLVADRKDPAALKAALAGAGKFDIVFDNNVRKLNEVQPLVEGVQSTGGCEQFILMSSAGVYGPTDVLPLSEENPGDPNSRHKEKLRCEQYLDSQGLNWTSIRSSVASLSSVFKSHFRAVSGRRAPLDTTVQPWFSH